MKSAAALRILGDSLIPSEVTSLLGCEPTRAESKGHVRSGSAGRQYVARTGGWSLNVDDRLPDDLDGQIVEILSRLNSDPEVWKALAAKFRIDIFCGLFMGESSEGFSISPATLMALGSRGIELAICLYSPIQDSEGENRANE